jgi:hypothetical protein
MRALAVIRRDFMRKSLNSNISSATVDVCAGVEGCATKALATALQCTPSFASDKRAERPSRTCSELLLLEAGRADPSASMVVMERLHIPERYMPPHAGWC